MSTYRFSTLGAELASLAHTAEMADKAGVDARIECNSAPFRPYPSGPMAPMNKSQSSAPVPFTTNESNRRQSSACTARSTHSAAAAPSPRTPSR